MLRVHCAIIAIALGISPILAADSLSSQQNARPRSYPLTAAQPPESLHPGAGDTSRGRYSPPQSPTIDVVEDADWKFKLNPEGEPQRNNFDDSSWSSVSLPHTWNGVDAATAHPAGSDGWYRKRMSVEPAMQGRELYLHFGAASIVTSLYIDGKQIALNPAAPSQDSHQGAFQAFVFDVTSALNAPLPAGQSEHLIAVHTNSANHDNVAPANGGDYSRQGGLYRDVTLLAVNPAHIALAETIHHPGVADDVPSLIADSGSQFSNSTVVIGSPAATITVRTVLDHPQRARSLTVHSYLVDADGIIQAQANTAASLEDSQAGMAITQSAMVAHPHLWDARIDPYLYDLYVELRDRDTHELLDVRHQRVGIRSFRINPAPNPDDPDPMNRAAFMLNGHPYRIVGVDMHQDSGRLDAQGNPVGWAQTPTQILQDLDLVAGMGATAIRTSHYQDNPAFYSDCDQLGIMVYTENAINQSINDSPAFLANAEDQYNELIRQNYNHPCIFAWGFGNETAQSDTLANISRNLQKIAHALDPSRVTSFAQYGGSRSSSTNADGVPDIKGTHPYDYWYGPSDVKATYKAYPLQPLGVTEYGGGGSAYQYADHYMLPVSKEPGGVRTHFHPENQQTRLEELHYTDLSQLQFLWGLFTWQMFDHGSSGKNEGDQSGINDKGLGTRDRVLKDSYYFYQASLNDPSRSWSNRRVLKISDRFWTVHNIPGATVTVFSNIGAPQLKLNGRDLGTMKPFTYASGLNSSIPGAETTVADTYTASIELSVGANALEADCKCADGQEYRDAAVWTYRNHLDGVPFTKVDFVGPGQPPAPDYLADDGGPYEPHGNQAYGWLPASAASGDHPAILRVGRSFGSASSDPAQNGITLNYDPIFKSSSVWQMSLPNGVYDVRIGAGQPNANDGVNMFALQGKVAAIGAGGPNHPDTFYCRIHVLDGHLTLAAAPGAFNTRISFIDINKLSVDDTPALVSKVLVNGGNRQRSMIRSLSVMFNRPVIPNNETFSLQCRDGASYPLAALNPSGDEQTFSMKLASGRPLESLPDGVYTLRVDNAKLSGATMPAPFTFMFHRLFGDVNGDRTVDRQDLLLYQLAKEAAGGASVYSSAFDVSADGRIDDADEQRIQRQLGRTLTY